jgi:hypothetical protein
MFCILLRKNLILNFLISISGKEFFNRNLFKKIFLIYIITLKLRSGLRILLFVLFYSILKIIPFEKILIFVFILCH